MRKASDPQTEPANEPVDDADDANLSPQDFFLLQEAKEHLAGQRYLRAAKLLSKVSDPEVLSKKYRRCLEMAHECQGVLDELLVAPPDDKHHSADGWIKQEETHSDLFDAQIFYKVDQDQVKKSSAIFCRIESPIDEDMLVPLLAVLNESEFYATWMPNWKRPVRLGVQSSKKLRQLDRGHQLVYVKIDMPFPFKSRECIMHAFAVDDIDDSQAIILKVNSVDTDPGIDLDTAYCGSKVPPQPEKGTIRVDFNAGFLIRKCPLDHPLLLRSKHKYTKPLLVSVTQQMNAHVGLVPMSLINFFTKSVLGKMWQTLLTVALEVRDGTRAPLAEAILAKGELYDWVKQRAIVLLKETVESSTDFLEVGLESMDFNQ
jgi:hypothetical protein